MTIENCAGAGGNIGIGSAARAAPDGYTILVVSSSYVVNPSLYDKVPYDPDKELRTRSRMVAASPNVLFVKSLRFRAKSVAELIALIKASPGKYRLLRSRRQARRRTLAGELCSSCSSTISTL